MRRKPSPIAWACPSNDAGHSQGRVPTCLALCAALSLPRSRPWNESERSQGRFVRARGALYGGRGGADFRSGLGASEVPMNELLLDYLPLAVFIAVASGIAVALDRKSTRLNSSHVAISYA